MTQIKLNESQNLSVGNFQKFQKDMKQRIETVKDEYKERMQALEANNFEKLERIVSTYDDKFKENESLSKDFISTQNKIKKKFDTLGKQFYH
jgi:DNA anti-recombination protein RmuC